jgi:hypothetical protein
VCGLKKPLHFLGMDAMRQAAFHARPWHRRRSSALLAGLLPRARAH